MKNFTGFSKNIIFITKGHIILILALFQCTALIGQVKYIEPGKKYSTVKICLKNYQFKTLKNLSLVNDSTLEGNSPEYNSKRIIPVRDVKFLQERKGSHAVSYGLLGAGIGFTSVLLANVETGYEGVDIVPMYLGFTLGGAAIGSLIGACIPRWDKLYLRDNGIPITLRASPGFFRYNSTNFYSLTLNFLL